MSDELKSTQIYYGENVLMMRVDDCLIFGNKDALRRLAEKLEERTAKVKVRYCVGYCECGQAVNTYSTYCHKCGARLDWSEDE